jgi:hypothetical protein
LGSGDAASKREHAKRYLLANPQASNEQVVKACHVSQRLVSMARAELRTQGLIPPAFGDWKSTSPPTPPEAPGVPLITTEQLLAQGAAEVVAVLDPEMSYEDQLLICKKFANAASQSPQVRLAAIQQYNKIKTDRVQAESLGPGEPANDKDRIRRLSRILEAVGFVLAVAAFETAFGKANDAQATDAAGAAPSVSAPADEPAAHGDGDADLEGDGERGVGFGGDPAQDHD